MKTKSAHPFLKIILNRKGMTLIEILIVLAIIGALMASLLPMIFSRLEKSRVSQTKIAMSGLVSSLNLYNTDCGKFPTSLEGLVKADADCSNWGPEPYEKKLPKDGWNRDFVYESTSGNYTLKSLGKDGREGGEGTAKDITNEEIN